MNFSNKDMRFLLAKAMLKTGSLQASSVGKHDDWEDSAWSTRSIPIGKRYCYLFL